MRGSGLLGDIGLDDIKLLPSTQGQCAQVTDCTFETGFCAFRNTLIGDQFDWSLQKGSTASSGTGPTADNTLKNANGWWTFLNVLSLLKIVVAAYNRKTSHLWISWI